MQAENIKQVIKELDKIIAWAEKENSRVGYFTALYRRVTVDVKEKIAQKYFDNNERMEELDDRFANRYLAAYTAFRNGEEMTESWRVAFDATTELSPIVLQHLLVGMNAHINLDLGIAAAEIAPGDKYKDLEDDFDKINKVLAGLVDDVKEELAQIWWLLGIVNRLFGELEKVIINFSMRIARNEAWDFGGEVARADKSQRANLIKKRDKEVAKIGRLVVNPPLFSRIIIWIIRLGEPKSVSKIIGILNEKAKS